jgi:hypothetical protein
MDTANERFNYIAFTICSNNYLAHAKTLVDSIIQHNPDCKVFIGLVDKMSPEIDYSFFGNATIIELNESVIPGYDDMIARYNIVELNTAVKPFLFEYLIKNHAPAFIYYFDPDIRVFQRLDYLHEHLKTQAIVLTPHFYTPIPIDGKYPFENLALNYGIYNLGFIGLNAACSETKDFLKWWAERTFKLGYSRVHEGFFVDQLWINLVPLFFKKVKILEHHGCNMAPWNLHERKIKSYNSDGTILLANGEYLIFYHFSSYDFKNSGSPSKYYNRYDFNTMPEIRKLYDDYLKLLLNNKALELSTIKCSLPIITYEPRLKHKIFRPLMPVLKAIWEKM